MKTKGAGGLSLFLIEILLSILFFAVAIAVCVQVYAGAHKKSLAAEELSHAVIACENAAQTLYADESLPSEQYYDGMWNACAVGEAEYAVKAEYSVEDNMLSGDIRAIHITHRTEIYSLEIKRFLTVE